MRQRTDQPIAEATSGRSIEEIIQLTNLSAPHFSRMYGIPYRTLQDWRNGRRVPPRYVLDLLEFKVLFDYDLF